MATDDVVAGVLARLLLDKPNSQDEHSTPHLHELWIEHLGDMDDRDIVAACHALLDDPQARFPTVGQFRDETQIQSRDRIRRATPPDAGPFVCVTCAGLRFVFIETPGYPWTVRPCECNEHQYQLWLSKHYRRDHLCNDCSESVRRRNRGRTPARNNPEPVRADPQVTARMFGEHF
jgi:hypothetical protein